jgi:hypothetical protein
VHKCSEQLILSILKILLILSITFYWTAPRFTKSRGRTPSSASTAK